MIDSECLFCKIAQGQVACYKIYEDEYFLAFLDIFPLTDGHTLVIPKQHFRWVWDVQPAGPYFEAISKIANQLRQKLGTDMIFSMTVGEAVPHAHYHLVPDGQGLNKVFAAISVEHSKIKLSTEKAEQLKTKLSLL